MTTTFKSPYARQFISAVKSGTPCSTVVWNMSKKTRTPVNTIWNSLWKAGCCTRQKFNGTWVYWPTFNVKTAKNTTKITKWQSFVEWCTFNGWCTPGQFTRHSSTQASFNNFCRSFFGWSTASKTSTKRATKRTTKRRTSRKPSTTAKKHWTTTSKSSPKRTVRSTKTWGNSWNKTYKFPTLKNRTNNNTRRYRYAA